MRHFLTYLSTSNAGQVTAFFEINHKLIRDTKIHVIDVMARTLSPLVIAMLYFMHLLRLS